MILSFRNTPKEDIRNPGKKKIPCIQPPRANRSFVSDDAYSYVGLNLKSVNIINTKARLLSKSSYEVSNHKDTKPPRLNRKRPQNHSSNRSSKLLWLLLLLFVPSCLGGSFFSSWLLTPRSLVVHFFLTTKTPSHQDKTEIEKEQDIIQTTCSAELLWPLIYFSLCLRVLVVHFFPPGFCLLSPRGLVVHDFSPPVKSVGNAHPTFWIPASAGMTNIPTECPNFTSVPYFYFKLINSIVGNTGQLMEFSCWQGIEPRSMV